MIGRNKRWKIIMAVLSTMFSKGNCDIIAKPIDTEVRVGDSTYLNCSISDTSGEVSWYHYPVGDVTKQHRYVYTFGRLNDPYDKRFRLEKLHLSGSFNLVVMKAELQDAGLYVCQDSGKSQNTSSAELVVLESDPICRSNINPIGLIGPNDCKIKQETIQVSCRVDYMGNVPPEIQWTQVKDGNVIPTNGPLSTCSVSDPIGSITCSYSVTSDIRLDRSYFICQTVNSRRTLYKCSTDYVKILYALQYAKQSTGNLDRPIRCSVKTNSLDCSFKWIWSDGVNEEEISRKQDLILSSQGWHRCQANCSIKHHRCIFYAVVINSVYGGFFAFIRTVLLTIGWILYLMAFVTSWFAVIRSNYNFDVRLADVISLSIIWIGVAVVLISKTRALKNSYGAKKDPSAIGKDYNLREVRYSLA